MATLNTNLKCGNCDNGVIVLTVKKVGDKIEAKTTRCNVCGLSVGLKGIQELVKITKQS